MRLTIGPLAETPLDLSLSRAAAWTDLLRIRGRRVTLRPGPAEAAARAYVVDGDVVGLLQRGPGWLRVEYVGDGGRVSRGWIKADEAQPLTPPARR